MEISKICNLAFNNQGIDCHSVVPGHFYQLAKKMENKKVVEYTLKENIRLFLCHYLGVTVEYDEIVYNRKPLYELVGRDIFVMKLHAFKYMKLYNNLGRGYTMDFLRCLAEDYSPQEVVSFAYSTVYNSYNDLRVTDFQIITKLPVDFFSFASGSNLLTPKIIRLAIGEEFITPDKYSEYLLTQEEGMKDKREAYKKYLKRWLLAHYEHNTTVVREYPDYQMVITSRIRKYTRYKLLRDFIQDNFPTDHAYYITFRNSKPVITERIQLILDSSHTHPIDFFFNTILSKLDSLYNNPKVTREYSNSLREFIRYHRYSKSLPNSHSF